MKTIMKTRAARVIAGALLAGTFSTAAYAEMETSGSVVVGAKQVSSDTDSAKFNEYRDNREGTSAILQELEVKGENDSNYYFSIRGEDVGLKDQSLNIKAGGYGVWSAIIDWNETPHNLSDNAKSPYTYQGGGDYTLPAALPAAIGFADISASAANQAMLDAKVKNNLPNALLPIDLGTQRKTGKFDLKYQVSERTKVGFEYQRDTKEGSLLTGTILGDRPPRTLAVQLPEPVDYVTDQYTIGAEHRGAWWHANAAAVFSSFTNNVDAMTWDNLFAAPAAGKDFASMADGTSTRRYAAEGRMALAPDNTMQNLNAGLGFFGLPMNSAFDLQAARATMKQNAALLPYSTSTLNGTWNSLNKLPTGVTSANGDIETTTLNARYTFTPFDAANVNVFYRYHDLNNKTPMVQFQYTTGDSGNGGYRNKRINLAHDITETSYGLDLSYRLGDFGSLGLGYEQEKKDRPYREVKQTKEDIFTASYRVSPFKGVNFKAKYAQGDRKGDGYNSEAPDASYWYSASDANDSDNPLFAFGNLPGLRKKDVADRLMRQYDVSLGIMPARAVAVNLQYGAQNNEYKLGDISSNPADYFQNGALTQGKTVIDTRQLGLLDDNLNVMAADVNLRASDALALFAYYARTVYKGNQRGRMLNENNRTVAASDWSPTEGYVWDAAVTDTNDTFGAGLDYTVIEGTLDFNADYTYTKGVYAIAYTQSGTGISSYGKWASPPDEEQTRNALKLAATYHLTETFSLGLNYLYEKYTVKDWAQEGFEGYTEDLIDAYYIGDAIGDRQGNRLVRLGDYLSPDYTAHVASVTVGVKF